MTTQRILWVSPHLDEWHVHEGDATRPEAMFDAREDALDWACRLAQFRGPAAVRVLDYSGSITSQYFFPAADRSGRKQAA